MMSVSLLPFTTKHRSIEIGRSLSHKSEILVRYLAEGKFKTVLKAIKRYYRTFSPLNINIYAITGGIGGAK
jgi:hypothetical protein